MSDCTIAAQVLEKREEPAEYLVDRMIRICRDQLMLPIRQTMERIDCHEICFMESRGHNVYIYTKNREIRIYQKLTDLVDLLPDYFHQCHKSYIVNLEYVVRLERTLLYMADGRMYQSAVHIRQRQKRYMKIMSMPEYCGCAIIISFFLLSVRQFPYIVM